MSQDDRNLHVEVSKLGKAGLKNASLTLFMEVTALNVMLLDNGLGMTQLLLIVSRTGVG